MYNFTELAVQLNEPEEGVAPTDSRLRPDQRLMEQTKWDEANKEKLRLEEKQRSNRMKKRESIQSTAVDTNENSDEHQAPQMEDHIPAWFKRTVDPYTNQMVYLCNDEYWDCKERKDWSRCPDLF
jgi:hypothetical protein